MLYHTTAELIEAIRLILDERQAIEEESELPDAGFAQVSLDFARSNLGRLWPGNPPRLFLERYVQILENRFRRLTDEDSGEYGSGRDALGAILTQLEQISCRLAA